VIASLLLTGSRIVRRRVAPNYNGGVDVYKLTPLTEELPLSATIHHRKVTYPA
jgi:hypothetical protein